MFISVFTPTYNRATTLPQLYDSLINQTHKKFEWIVVNDGSTDDTEKLISKWKDDNVIDIVYIYQENNGKHIAMNKAVKEARGDFLTTVDSDDALLPDGLAILVKTWEKIPKEEWGNYVSVKSDCMDMATGKKLGPSFKNGILICNYLDARYKEKINYEMQALTRIKVLKEYPNPEILGGPQRGGLRYYPETIWQDLAARKYLTIFIDKCTCEYRTNSSESLLGRGRKYNRHRENIYLWAHIINDNFDYFAYNPKEFIKSFIGMSMDGIFNGMRLGHVLSMIKGVSKKAAVVFFYPIGFLCYLKRK